MFIKLFKYDFLSIIKKMVYYYIILFAATIFYKVIDLILSGTKYEFITVLPELLYTAILIFGLTVSLIMCMIRYYKNMLSDQGYLTHTLPVKRSHILLSKLLATLVIELITLGAMLISILIASFNLLPQIFDEIMDVLKQISSDAEGGHVIAIMLYVLVFIALSAVFNVAFISLCLTLGSLHNKNKLVMAFAYYMIINFVLEILLIVGIVIIVAIIAAAGIEFSFGLLYTGLSLSALAFIGMIIVAYFINLKFLNTKLNLE